MNNKYLNLYILSMIIVVVFISTFFIKVGTFQYDQKGLPIANTYGEVKTEPLTIRDLVTSPVNGMIGIVKPPAHNINYQNSGTMAGSISLMILVLAIGAYMQVIEKTNVLKAFIMNNIQIIGKRLNFGVFLVMLLFALGATTHGMYETTIGFAPLLILMYDQLQIKRIEVLFLMLLPLAAGHIGGTINPFATGIATQLLNISILDGMMVRIVLLVVLFALSVVIVLRRLKKYPRIIVEKTEKQRYNRLILFIFLIPFLIMIGAFIPGSSLKLDFITVAITFIGFGILVGLIGRLPFATIIDQLFVGMHQYFLVAFCIGFARGIYVLLYNSYLSDTLINQATLLLAQQNMVILIIILMVIFLVLGFLIPSTSALAMISMPILGMAMIMLNVAPELIVTIYQAMIGVLKIIAPTSPVVVGLLLLTEVKYWHWFKACYRYVLLYIGVILIILILFYGG